jgi:methionyl-tRNA formyltransferase
VKIVFFGTPAAAAESLGALHAAGFPILGVVTQPDRRRGRSARKEPPPAKVRAIELDLPVLQPEKVRCRSFRESIERLNPDVLVVVAYGRILSKRLMDAIPHGAVNLHFSLLPAYRGAAPVQWAIARGETVTGVSTMQMSERLDAGPILLQESVPIGAEEKAVALTSRLAARGSSLLVETLQRMSSDNLLPRAQSEEDVSFAPILTRADGAGDPALTAQEIACRVRGFDPWPGFRLRSAEQTVRLCSVRPVPMESGKGSDAPGTLLDSGDGGLTMVCGGGSRLSLLELQPEGRRVQSAREIRNGRSLQPGDRLLSLETD